MAIRVHKKEEAKSHIRFLKMGYAILQKRISHLVDWHMRFFANVRIYVFS